MENSAQSYNAALQAVTKAIRNAGSSYTAMAEAAIAVAVPLLQTPTIQLPVHSWQLFQSAPKDGTWFLAYRPQSNGGTWDRICIVRWSNEETDFVWPEGIFDIYLDDLSDRDQLGYLKHDTYSAGGSFTHWCRLPAAPEVSA